jgi:hypothetical protein
MAKRKMETRIIRGLENTGRITRAQALKAAKKVILSRSEMKSRPTKIVSAADTASGKGLIRFRSGRVAP